MKMFLYRTQFNIVFYLIGLGFEEAKVIKATDISLDLQMKMRLLLHLQPPP